MTVSTLESLISESGDFSCYLKKNYITYESKWHLPGSKNGWRRFPVKRDRVWGFTECHERQAMSALVKVSVEAISKRFASLLGFSSDTPKTDQETASKAVACLIH